MALYGILAGIDGNLEALHAVLAACDARGVTKLACVGNIVGYNADPDECGEILRARKALVVAGEHDRIATRMQGYGSCSNGERHALARTRREMRRDTAAWLRALPATRELDEGIVLDGAKGQCRLARGAIPFIAPGSVDAQRKPHRFAECAIFDSDAGTVDYLRLRYDAAATEAKAAVAGYRGVPLFGAFYSVSRMARVAVASLPALRMPGTIIGTSAR